MGIEVEDYTACWIEITVDEPSDMDAKQVVLLGTDFQYWLNGSRLTITVRNSMYVRAPSCVAPQGSCLRHTA